MTIIIPPNAAEVATGQYWQDILQCSRATLLRGERSGKLTATGTKRHKLYTKAAIYRWLGVEATE
jgi:hypothetical protein